MHESTNATIGVSLFFFSFCSDPESLARVTPYSFAVSSSGCHYNFAT